jgi:hypothetical protein
MPSLTQNEKEMLIHALPSGQICLMRAGQVGDFVQSGSFDYLDDHDPSLQARGIDTLDSLQAHGLVRFQAGQLYKLTGSGFDQARQLEQQQKQP